ncbi:hypothetical protein [Micromonospora cremea]|uniref:Major facilitator superfamily (MFS) profile domain-containing protein n=1 Tax=Micromonospora cremea TaxID=709881 RepID=A0A1N5VX33_9ACTN|nr:hypothetical protein [Micromonospora cremea]SIM77633.1 hypothetical protein SAMN04489832_1961 [Micromonospora cremea]
MTETVSMSQEVRDAPRRQVAITALLIVGGVLILFVPATGEGSVLVPLSEGHGLSAVDMVGAALLALGGTWLEVLVVRRLPYLALSPRALFGLGLLAGLGMGLLIASVFSGFFWWWAVGATALGVAVLVLVPRTARR